MVLNSLVQMYEIYFILMIIRELFLGGFHFVLVKSLLGNVNTYQ